MKELRETVILVGGMGTRLRSVISDRPKVLAVVRGKPFLAYLLDHIAAAGIKHTILCVGYKGEQIQTAFGVAYSGMRLTYSQETSLLGTGGALRLALTLATSEAFIVMNGDSFCDVNLRDLWEWHIARQAAATMVLSRQPDTARYGRVSFSADGMVSNFEEKRSDAGPGWINAGIYVFNSEMVQTIPSDKVVSLERKVLPGWVGHGLYGYPCEGRFIDIGTPESYAEADALFALNRK